MHPDNKFKEAEYRENQMGTEFLFCPPDEFNRVFITGEITDAQDFPETQLFLSYRLTLPVGWKTELPEEYLSLDLSEQEFEELNCMNSVTQSTLPVFENSHTGVQKTKFYFSFPVDWQLLVRSTENEWPVLHFEVYSKDYWDRILMHGCGFFRIPSTPGHHQLSVETWKPVVDLKTRLSEFFLGGVIKLKNLELISKAEKLNQMDQEGPINRHLYSSMSSGTVNMTLNIAIQSKNLKDEERIQFKAYKLSEKTEERKKEIPNTIPSLVNTGNITAGRYTNTRLYQ